MPCVKGMDDARELLAACLQAEVDVVRHEAPGDASGPGPSEDLLGAREVVLLVLVIVEEDLFGYRSGPDVVEIPEVLGSRDSRHVVALPIQVARRVRR
jgi:hypothetical protein